MGNIYGNYLGVENPQLKNGKGDSYTVPPVNQLDYSAFLHDKGYDFYGVRGPNGVFTNIDTWLVDLKLVNDAMSYEGTDFKSTLIQRGVTELFS